MSIDPLLDAGDRRDPDRRADRRGTDRGLERRDHGRDGDRSAPLPPPVIRTAGPRRRPGRFGVAAGVLVAAAAIGVGVAVATGGDDEDAPPTTAVAAAPTTLAVPTTAVPSIDQVGSIWWLVNPQRPMAADYVPPDLVTPEVPMDPDVTNPQVRAEVATAFEVMVAEAATAGFQLQLNSGYRSYEEQQVLYDRFVADFGAEVAAQRVALAGTSEHQTGLSLDVGQVGLPDDQVFGDTQASVWVADNAHRFGFILRYPPDKAHITGYTNEPWHLRFVGVDLATQLHDNGLTMEEHFGLVPPEPATPSS